MNPYNISFHSKFMSDILHLFYASVQTRNDLLILF